MQRVNGQPMRVRVSGPTHQTAFLGRLTCIRCGTVVPRGSARPFCLDHAVYVQRLMQQIAAMEQEALTAVAENPVRKGNPRAA